MPTGFERRRLLALPCGLNSPMVGLRSDRELAGGRVRRGAGPAGGTGPIRGPIKPDADNWSPRDIASRPQQVDTAMTLRTVGLVGIPIQHKGLQGIALSGLMLTAIGSKGRTHHIDLILVLRGHEEVGMHGAAVE